MLCFGLVVSWLAVCWLFSSFVVVILLYPVRLWLRVGFTWLWLERWNGFTVVGFRDAE